MKLTAFTALAISTLLISMPALARDSSHLVCSGYMAAQPDPDNYGISIQLDEFRAADGENRLEILSSVWAQNLYQGKHLNKDGGGLSEKANIVIAAPGHSKQIFFKGSYGFAHDAKTDSDKLVLNGVINLTPGDAHGNQKISTTLNCVDISN